MGIEVKVWTYTKITGHFYGLFFFAKNLEIKKEPFKFGKNKNYVKKH